MGLADFIGVLARRWPVILLAGVVAAAAAFVVGSRSEPSYSATAQVLVREGVSEGVARLVPALMRDYNRDWNTRVAELRSQNLAGEVIDSGGYDMSAASLAGRVQVATDVTNGYVSVSVSDTDPEMAAELTNAVALGFAERSRADQEEALGVAIASAEKQLTEARERVAPIGTGEDGLLGDQSYESVASTLDTLEMGWDAQVDPVVVTREAVAPSAVSGPSGLKVTLFGLLAGLALGVVLALGLEYFARAGAVPEA